MKRISRLLAIVLSVILLAGMTCSASATALSAQQELNVYYTLYSLAMESADYQDALAQIEACLAMNVELDDAIWGDLYLKRGYAKIYLGDEASAMEDINKSLEYIPTSADAMLLRIQLLVNAADTQGALAQAESFVKIYPDQLSVYLTIAELFAAAVDYESAIAAYTAYINTPGEKDPSGYQLRGQYLILVGRFEEAIADLDIYMEKAEEPAIRARYLRAIACIQMQQFEKALEDLNHCAELVEKAWADGEEAIAALDTDMMNSHYYRGVVLMQLARYEEAIADFSQCVERDVNKDEATYWRANSAMEAGDYAAATADFAACIETGVNVDLSCYYFGICLMAQEEYQDAIDAFSVCVEENIMLEQALYNRGMCYIKIGENELGKADLTASVANGEADSAELTDEIETK